ncbi:TSUP family transporter [Pseudoalteromonas mariniglutinosa]|uniref:TSUP family transporter n=1 Tax=Pseudoalteromonas mariniglutinosa TaxID=206042 RepID=UPI00384D3269
MLLFQGAGAAIDSVVAELSIAVTMAFGSFVAGGTALGGGAVAFPVMTKLLAIEPTTAKVFSLAIQNFGMSAATLTIIFTRIPYYRNVLFIASPAALAGVLISLIFIADLLSRMVIKGVFSLLLLCFVVTLIWRIYRRSQHLCNQTEITIKPWHVILTAGVGGIASGLVGSGADIAIFALLIIVYSANIQKATATAVIIMAVTSVVASVSNVFFLDTLSAEVKGYLLAAIPVVVLGALLGAYICAKAKNSQLIAFLLLLIVLEVSFTLYEIIPIDLNI